jgi:lipoprotein-anchoring transpeptidase ErfK/SrfK
MPFMQRLTAYGIALHAGHLPGYPASHGCIRLPWGFAKRLYGLTGSGTTVTITRGRAASEPRIPARPSRRS